MYSAFEIFRKDALIRVFAVMGLMMGVLGCSSKPKPQAQVRNPGGIRLMKDGTYEAAHTEKYVGRDYNATVRVTLQEGIIVGIEVITADPSHQGRQAENILPARIIEKQTPNVDVVTGATYSSTVIIKAVQKAIELSHQ